MVIGPSIDQSCTCFGQIPKQNVDPFEDPTIGIGSQFSSCGQKVRSCGAEWSFANWPNMVNSEVFTLLKKKPQSRANLFGIKPKHLVAFFGGVCGVALIRQVVWSPFGHIRRHHKIDPCEDARFLNLDELALCTTSLPYNASEKVEILHHLRQIVGF